MNKILFLMLVIIVAAFSIIIAAPALAVGNMTVMDKDYTGYMMKDNMTMMRKNMTGGMMKGNVTAGD